MASDFEINIPINQITSQITATIRIKGMKTWRLKTWLANQIVKMIFPVCAWLFGCKYVVEKD